MWRVFVKTPSNIVKSRAPLYLTSSYCVLCNIKRDKKNRNTVCDNNAYLTKTEINGQICHC